MYKVKQFFKTSLIFFTLYFLISCSQQTNVEGDIFIVKGDGTPQPAAAKEIFFIKYDGEVSSAESALIDTLTNVYVNQLTLNKPSDEVLLAFCESVLQKQNVQIGLFEMTSRRVGCKFRIEIKCRANHLIVSHQSC